MANSTSTVSKDLSVHFLIYDGIRASPGYSLKDRERGKTQNLRRSNNREIEVGQTEGGVDQNKKVV